MPSVEVSCRRIVFGRSAPARQRVCEINQALDGCGRVCVLRWNFGDQVEHLVGRTINRKGLTGLRVLL